MMTYSPRSLNITSSTRTRNPFSPLHSKCSLADRLVSLVVVSPLAACQFFCGVMSADSSRRSRPSLHAVSEYCRAVILQENRSPDATRIDARARYPVAGFTGMQGEKMTALPSGPEMASAPGADTPSAGSCSETPS